MVHDSTFQQAAYGDKWLASVSRNVQLYGRSLISPYTAARAPVALVLGGDAPVGSGDRETPRGLNEQLIEASSVAPMGASTLGIATVTHA
jgi:hypothetical protein